MKQTVHINTYTEFLKKKISNSSDDQTYCYGGIGEVYEGEPDYKYQQLVFVKDKHLIYTHGTAYNCSPDDLYSKIGDLSKLEESVSADNLVESINILARTSDSELSKQVTELSEIIEEQQKVINEQKQLLQINDEYDKQQDADIAAATSLATSEDINKLFGGN